MVAGLESLPHAHCSNTIRSITSLVLKERDGDKDREFLAKIEILTFRHSKTMKTDHWTHLFAVMDSPCA